MRWPWRRREPASNGHDAARARKAAEARLAEARSRTEEVERVAESLRRLRRRNEFAAMIEQAFGGRS